MVTVRHTVRQTLLLRNVTRSTKLRGAQRSPELALRSTDFRSPENLIFPALFKAILKGLGLVFWSDILISHILLSQNHHYRIILFFLGYGFISSVCGLFSKQSCGERSCCRGSVWSLADGILFSQSMLRLVFFSSLMLLHS